MKARIVLGFIVMMFILGQTGNAGEMKVIKKYFNDTACKVKATADPVQKREILTKSLQNMSEALEKVQSSRLVSKEDLSGIDRFKAALQEKQDELKGSNGNERVPDAQLNAFSDYVVQNMEQAEQYITINVVTILLIVLILIILI